MGKRAEAPADVQSSETDRRAQKEEWLIAVIDVLASEYHWSKKDILEDVYPEEIEPYTRRIGERKKQEALDKIHDYRILLEATVAPHTEKGIGATHLLEYLNKAEKKLKNPLDELLDAEDPILKAMKDHKHIFG